MNIDSLFENLPQDGQVAIWHVCERFRKHVTALPEADRIAHYEELLEAALALEALGQGAQVSIRPLSLVSGPETEVLRQNIDMIIQWFDNLQREQYELVREQLTAEHERKIAEIRKRARTRIMTHRVQVARADGPKPAEALVH